MATTPENEATRPDGIEMYGLYLEAIEIHRVTERARRYWRFFLVNDRLYVYARGVDKKATTWRASKYDNHDAARAKLVETLDGTASVKFVGRGEPILTQLRPSDIIALDRGQIPPARYTGQQRLEAAIGKFDAAHWSANPEGGAAS